MIMMTIIIKIYMMIMMALQKNVFVFKQGNVRINNKATVNGVLFFNKVVFVFPWLPTGK